MTGRQEIDSSTVAICEGALLLRFKVVHAADLHLDTPCSGLGRTAPAVAAALREASLEAFAGLVELCLREEAAILLLAGDVYDGPERGIRAERRLRAGLERLGVAGVRTFAVHGNHDPLSGDGGAAWGTGTHVFAADEVTAVPVERDGTVIATVHGISFREREERRNLARLFRPSGEGLQIGLLHANVGDPQHAPYAPCSTEDLRAAGMDYWALGHVHGRRLVLEGGPWGAYPGVLQGRSPAGGETGAKGALVLACDDRLGLLEPPRFVALDRIRFETLEVDISGAMDVQDAIDRLETAAQTAREEAEGRGVILRATLTGDFGPEAELQLRQGEILASLQETGLAQDPFVWWDALDLRTRAPILRDEIRGGGDLAAEVLREADRLRASPDDLGRILGELEQDLSRFPVRDALAGRTPAADLLTEAEEICLRLLTGGDGR